MIVEYCGCLTERTHSKFFFFSSRRRPTRSTRDWSSDVCSSDLAALEHERDLEPLAQVPGHAERGPPEPDARRRRPLALIVCDSVHWVLHHVACPVREL